IMELAENREPLCAGGQSDLSRDDSDAKARVLATYSDSYYAGKAALIEKKTGNGRTLHLGSAFSRENVKLLLEYAGVLSPFDTLIEAPEGVELVQRRKNGQTWMFALNFQSVPQTIALKQPMKRIFEECEADGEVVLAPYETEVFCL
ncbi:MAG: Beta-galactosidase C-terminal domain, partial [Lachnospiraceae bacterium]|nr:Beta-galactosidase C-terminal domain [Lachnospiraceae bacterium]